MVCLWLYMPVMLSFVSSAAKTLLPELFKDIFRFEFIFPENKRGNVAIYLIFVMRRENTESELSITIIHSWFHCYWWHSLYFLRTNEEMWPSTWQFGWFQNIDVCNNETHINKYWLHPKRSWTHRALPSSGYHIWTRFRLVIGRLKWLSCGRWHLIFQQLIHDATTKWNR